MTDHDLTALRRVLSSRYLTCDGTVTQRGEEDACEKPAVGVVDGRGVEDGDYWTACAWHLNRWGGRGRTVPLATLLLAAPRRVP